MIAYYSIRNIILCVWAVGPHYSKSQVRSTLVGRSLTSGSWAPIPGTFVATPSSSDMFVTTAGLATYSGSSNVNVVLTISGSFTQSASAQQMYISWYTNGTPAVAGVFNVVYLQTNGGSNADFALLNVLITLNPGDTIQPAIVLTGSNATFTVRSCTMSISMA